MQFHVPSLERNGTQHTAGWDTLLISQKMRGHHLKRQLERQRMFKVDKKITGNCAEGRQS